MIIFIFNSLLLGMYMGWGVVYVSKSLIFLKKKFLFMIFNKSFTFLLLLSLEILKLKVLLMYLSKNKLVWVFLFIMLKKSKTLMTKIGIEMVLNYSNKTFFYF